MFRWCTADKMLTSCITTSDPLPRSEMDFTANEHGVSEGDPAGRALNTTLNIKAKNVIKQRYQDRNGSNKDTRFH